jgi:hypothetical protein
LILCIYRVEGSTESGDDGTKHPEGNYIY